MSPRYWYASRILVSENGQIQHVSAVGPYLSRREAAAEATRQTHAEIEPRHLWIVEER